MKRGPGSYNCSFCGKSHEKVQRVIAGPGGIYICNECIVLCNRIIDEEERMTPRGPAWWTMTRPGWLHALGSPVRLLRGRRRSARQRRPIAHVTR